MKLIFCGTPEFAVASLKSLLASHHQILAVITQPDRPAGRGRQLQPSAVKKAALDAGLPILQPMRIGEEDSLANIRQLEPDALVVVAYGQFLPKKLLNLPPHGCINVHASLLPAYRGAAPINWAIINGDKETGISTMRLDEGMDTGDVILTKSIAIERDETADSLHDKLALLGTQVLTTTLEQIESGSVSYQPQTGDASYAPALKKTDMFINWEKPAERIDCLVRGLTPQPGAHTYLGEKLFKILSLEISDEKYSAGLVGKTDKKRGILVGTGTFAVWLKTIQPPSRAPMPATNYLAGLREPLDGQQFTRGELPQAS